MPTFPFQTRLHDGVCQKRVAATIATHDLDRVRTPLLYDARRPDQMELVPLFRNKPVSAQKLVGKLRQEAEEHRKEKKRNTLSGIHKSARARGFKAVKPGRHYGVMYGTPTPTRESPFRPDPGPPPYPRPPTCPDPGARPLRWRSVLVSAPRAFEFPEHRAQQKCGEQCVLRQFSRIGVQRKQEASQLCGEELSGSPYQQFLHRVVRLCVWSILCKRFVKYAPQPESGPPPRSWMYCFDVRFEIISFLSDFRYLDLLKGKQLYPCLVDSEGDIVSFPPITNCDKTKVP